MNRWYVLDEEMLQSLLERSHEGEDPGLLLMELYVNSDTEEVSGE